VSDDDDRVVAKLGGSEACCGLIDLLRLLAVRVVIAGPDGNLSWKQVI
jgi:hypothetical protein